MRTSHKDNSINKCVFVCVCACARARLTGDDVPGGAQTGAPGPGSAERPGEIAQPHQDHRLRPGASAGRQREGVQRRRWQGTKQHPVDRHVPSHVSLSDVAVSHMKEFTLPPAAGGIMVQNWIYI